MAEELVVDIKEVQKKLEEMKIKDIEISGGREFKGSMSTAIYLIGLVMSLFHIVVLTVYPIDPWFFRTMHVVFAGVLVLALVPGWKNSPMDRLHLVDVIFILMLVVPAAYIFIEFDDWIYRVGVVPNTWDFIMSGLFVVAVWEMARRASGWPLAILAGVFILYGHFGNYMPGLFYHKGYDWDREITYLFSLDGILGLPVLASAHYIYLFVLFGAFVDSSGAGKFFVDFARCIAGRLRGGPAKVSILSSALVGTASGSSVANVVVDGVFNIPLMKASGFRGAVAGAIEAMNSTGGQIVPPVMGAGAFLMAEILGVPYPKVALAAVIPALFYFFAAYWMIDFYSANAGLSGMKKEELPVFRKVMLERGYLLIPIIVLLICLMVLMYSPYLSAMIGIVCLIIVSWVQSETRLGPKKIIDILSKGARGAMEIAATCAAAGIIVGRTDPDRPGDQIRHDHLRVFRGQPLHRALFHDARRNRARHGHAHHGRLRHLRIGAGAGLDPAERPGHRRAPVHLLLCLPFGLDAAGGAGLVCRRRHRQRQDLGGRLAGHAVCNCGLPDPLHVRPGSGLGIDRHLVGNRLGGCHRDFRNHRPGRLGPGLVHHPLCDVGAHRPGDSCHHVDQAGVDDGPHRRVHHGGDLCHSAGAAQKSRAGNRLGTQP